MAQIRELLNKVNSSSDAREIHGPETASSSGDPGSKSTLDYSESENNDLRDSGLPLDTQNCMGTLRNVFERPPAQGGPPAALFENSKNLASSSRGLRPDITGNTKRPESEMRRDSLNAYSFTTLPKWR